MVFTGYDIPRPSIIEARGDVEGGLFLWLETDAAKRSRGFEIEWKVTRTPPGKYFHQQTDGDFIIHYIYIIFYWFIRSTI